MESSFRFMFQSTRAASSCHSPGTLFCTPRAWPPISGVMPEQATRGEITQGSPNTGQRPSGEHGVDLARGPPAADRVRGGTHPGEGAEVAQNDFLLLRRSLLAG